MTTPSRMLAALKGLGREGVDRVAQRLDAFKNEVTGFGTTRDKTAYSQWDSFLRLTDSELSELYHGDSMAARIADAVPEEMFREGYSIETGDEQVNTWLADQHKVLNVRGKFKAGSRWARVFGGSAVLLGADDGRPSRMPLVPERVKALRYLYVIDRRYLQPLTYYTDPKSRKLGEPETYYVAPQHAHAGVTSIVHESRLILFRGSPTATQERQELGGWDHSVLQRPHEVLLQFNTGWKAVETMLTDANQAVFKMSGLAEALASNEADALRERMRVVDLYRSVMRAIVVDAGGVDGKGEEFQRQSLSFADIPATLDKLMLRLAGSVPMPVTILMGQSPAGMSATGQSDLEWWYNRIRSEQNTDIAPHLERIDEILLATQDSPAAMEKLEKHTIEFAPLWSLDDLQQAQRRGAIATADAAYITAGVYLPEEVALTRSQTDGFDREIELTPEARKAREDALAGSLDDLAAGTDDEDTDGVQPPPEE